MQKIVVVRNKLLWICCIMVLLVSCYTKQNVPLEHETDSPQRKSVIVTTHDDKTYYLTYYVFTEDTLVGQDQKGLRIKIPRSDVKEMVVKKANKVVVAGLIAVIGVLLMVVFAARGFTELGR